MYRILIAVDGSPHTDRTIEAVAALARTQAQFEVDLVHVLAPMLLGDMAPTLVQQVNDNLRAEQAVLLETMAALARSRGLTVRHAHATVGDPAVEIANIARDSGAQQIAMGTHGRGALGSLFMGSVAQAVVHHAGVPVLLVK
jgi:nucleotide-binding universal stress UspA family protein